MMNFNERRRRDELYSDFKRAVNNNDMGMVTTVSKRWSALSFAEHCIDSGADVEFTIDDVGLDALYTKLTAGKFGEVKIGSVNHNVMIQHMVNGVCHKFQWPDVKLYKSLNNSAM